MKRRSNILIKMQILEAVRTEPRGPTRLAQAVNLSFDKCVPYLQSLVQKGFIAKSSGEGRDIYAITQSGIDTFLEWERLWEKLRQ